MLSINKQKSHEIFVITEKNQFITDDKKVVVK